jgi:haloacid dehalogenase superfamily, subfamily IA, variant 3 with third motif having DD or ED/haloacid dehalogenase superfamily, subfamily IA, variant 1 with third motif having Dx(3-4)D or Dx(3-4)E
MTKTKAIIFDMDGTLVDNIPFHKEAWLSFLRKYNIILNPDQFEAQNHGNIEEMIRRFFGEELSDEEVIRLGQEKEQTYRDLYKNHLKEVSGLTDLLHRMKKQNIIAALATMGDTPNIDFILDSLNIRSFFDYITGGHEISRGKPDSEIFDLSLAKMNLKCEDCLVIEDSIGGVQSAQNAGIKVIGITTSYTSEILKTNGCFYTISNFKELNLDFCFQGK